MIMLERIFVSNQKASRLDQACRLRKNSCHIINMMKSCIGSHQICKTRHEWCVMDVRQQCSIAKITGIKQGAFANIDTYKKLRITIHTAKQIARSTT